MNHGERGGLRVGTSGYQYPHWRGCFYPKDQAVYRWFEHYASVFDTVEINATFYRLQEASVFERWRRASPPGFRFALKFSSFATHRKRLRDPEGPIDLFLERARRLGDRLGPILVQLPPRWSVNVDRLAAFLEAAPSSERWAFEFRDDRWLCPDVFALLRRHGAALCIHDLIPDHAREWTTDWIYLRFHGRGPTGGYGRRALASWARWIDARLEDGVSVFAYFNNDIGGHAPKDALTLLDLLGRSHSQRPCGS